MPPEKVFTRLRAPLPQFDHLHHLAHALADQLARHAVELGVQAQVLLGGEVAVERGVLEDEADVAAHVVAFAHDVVARPPCALPPVGRTSVQSMLIVVDLPAPLGPRKPNVSPAATSKSMPRTASTSP